jgi:hypothetical protein
VRQELIDRDEDPKRVELVRLAEQATRDLGLWVPKLCFELRREVLRRKALRTASLAGLPTQELERILNERDKEKGHKRCI